MLTGLQIEQCEPERELIRAHQKFIKTLGNQNTMKKDNTQENRNAYKSMYSRQRNLDEKFDQLEKDKLPQEYRKMLELKDQIEKQIREQVIRENYKGPSLNNEEILKHFYERQKSYLDRLSQYDVSEFAMRYRNQKLVQKAFFKIKNKAFKKSEIAKELNQLHLYSRCFKAIKQSSIINISNKKVNQQMNAIHKLFQTKKVFKAWKYVVQKQAKIHAIGEHIHEQKFCVKYSDFCKCIKCQYVRQNLNNIGPQNQKLQNVYLRLEEKEKTLQEILSREIRSGKFTKDVTQKCLPFSQIYENQNTRNETGKIFNMNSSTRLETFDQTNTFGHTGNYAAHNSEYEYGGRSLTQDTNHDTIATINRNNAASVSHKSMEQYSPFQSINQQIQSQCAGDPLNAPLVRNRPAVKEYQFNHLRQAKTQRNSEVKVNSSNQIPVDIAKYGSFGYN